MFHLLNHEFDHPKETEEKASDFLAGGIAQKGYQCGMLWGAALAAGAESFRRHRNQGDAIASAITASRSLVGSFAGRTGSVNCRDVSRVDFENKFEMTLFMIKTILKGFFYSPCFNLIVKWTPEAIRAANQGLSVRPERNQPGVSCASEVLIKMGATVEEAVMVAGFAGGIGLSGNACGALSAAIWYKILRQARQNPSVTPSYFNNQDVKTAFRSFYIQTGSEILCSRICGRQFATLDEHTAYIRNGGCSRLIDTLANLN
jgi:hypothetical protein